MTTETEMHRIIGTALWNEGIKGKYAIDETGITGLVINTNDGSEFQITIARSRAQGEQDVSEICPSQKLKTETEIRGRIDECVEEIKRIKTDLHYENPLIYGGEKRDQLKYLHEIGYLCWVLGETIPKEVFELLESESRR